MSSPLASSTSRPFGAGAGTLEGFPPPPALNPQIFVSELAVIGEMLGMLESLTNAGQQHVMTKIVGFIQGKVASGTIARRADRARVAELLERVRQESARPLPAVDAFRDAVARVLAVPGLLL